MTNRKAVFEQLLHCKLIVTDEDMYYYAVPYDVYKDICNVLKEPMVSKSDVLDTYAELYYVFDGNKEIQKELNRVYDKLNKLIG